MVRRGVKAVRRAGPERERTGRGSALRAWFPTPPSLTPAARRPPGDGRQALALLSVTLSPSRGEMPARGEGMALTFPGTQTSHMFWHF